MAKTVAAVTKLTTSSNPNPDVQSESDKLNALAAQLRALEEENAKLKAKATKALTLKVSEKGALSVYGLGRFPVTLYREQWERLLPMADTIREFIAANSADLKTKE